MQMGKLAGRPDDIYKLEVKKWKQGKTSALGVTASTLPKQTKKKKPQTTTSPITQQLDFKS